MANPDLLASPQGSRSMQNGATSELPEAGRPLQHHSLLHPLQRTPDLIQELSHHYFSPAKAGIPPHSGHPKYFTNTSRKPQACHLCKSKGGRGSSASVPIRTRPRVKSSRDGLFYDCPA